MVKDLKEILATHNQLQERYHKAENAFATAQEVPQKWIDEFEKLLEQHSKNFDEFYFYYEKEDVDKLINSNKMLSFADFAYCRKTEAGELCL